MAYPHGKKTYAELDLQERYEWHAENYAWRHLTLGMPVEKGNSPTDPKGEFFDLAMIEEQLVKLRHKRARMRRTGSAKPDDDALKGRALCNEYARSRGFTDFDTAFEAGAISYDEVARSVLAAGGGLPRMPGAEPSSEYNLARLQTDLGVTATEYAPPAAEMAASRAALDIPEPPPQQELATNV